MALAYSEKLKYIFVFTSFFLLSCEYLIPPQESGLRQGYQKPVTSASQGDFPKPDESNTPEADTASVWGKVACYNEGEKELERFNIQVRQFLSTTYNPQNLPTIGCTDKHRGGFFFKGFVGFENNEALDLSNADQGALVMRQSGSYIDVHIDPGTTKDSTKPSKAIHPLRFLAVSVTSQISSSGEIELHFRDDTGIVTLKGRMSQNVFAGEFQYRNQTTWQGGSTGFSGTIGVFQIRTCKFFKCK